MKKFKLELVVNDNGVIFLNHWNLLNGEDVTTEIKDGEIIDESGDGQKITLKEFIQRVVETSE